jgi:hypothetical protein
VSEIVYALGGHAFRRDDDGNLWDTASGKHVGRFEGDEVFSPNSVYLGELTSGGKLGTRISKLGKTGGGSFSQLMSRGATGHAPHASTSVLAGWQDFDPDDEPT